MEKPIDFAACAEFLASADCYAPDVQELRFSAVLKNALRAPLTPEEAASLSDPSSVATRPKNAS